MRERHLRTADSCGSGDRGHGAWGSLPSPHPGGDPVWATGPLLSKDCCCLSDPRPSEHPVRSAVSPGPRAGGARLAGHKLPAQEQNDPGPAEASRVSRATGALCVSSEPRRALRFRGRVGGGADSPLAPTGPEPAGGLFSRSALWESARRHWELGLGLLAMNYVQSHRGGGNRREE